MGRPGAGSGGGGSHHSSGGHDMSSRSSGGHRAGSRPGSGSSRPGFDHNNYSGGFRNNFDPGYHTHYHGYRGYASGPSISLNLPGWASALLTIIILIIVIGGFFFVQTAGVPRSTVNRVAIKNKAGFENDCVVDELGWVGNLSNTEKQLKFFYDKTGVQPFVYLKEYDPDLKTDADKTKYAEECYENNIKNETTFLVVYFGEEDADDTVGFVSHVCGKQVTSVMDAESIDIFYAYWDSNWYSDKSTDDVLIDTFASTADRIMKRSTTGMDIAKGLIFAFIVVVCVIGCCVVVILIHKRQREKAKEAQDLLNTPVEKIGDDDLTDKYL